jgi:hypothetical protein
MAILPTPWTEQARSPHFAPRAKTATYSCLLGFKAAIPRSLKMPFAMPARLAWSIGQNAHPIYGKRFRPLRIHIQGS